MLFIAILLLTTLSIAGTAAFFSVYGLSQIFMGMAVPVMIMGASLEAGKLVAASFLYRYWNDISWTLKFYLSTAVFILILITSIGIFGMLSAGYQSDSLPLKEIESKIQLLKEEQQQLIERKKEIDKQISNLPSNMVRGRQRLMSTFGPELEQINTRLPQITTEIQQLSSKQVHTQAHVGPIVYIAKAFNQDIDDATKWIVLVIIVVFDPLAVALTIGVNVALKKRAEEKQRKKQRTEEIKQQNIQQIEDKQQIAEKNFEQQETESNQQHNVTLSLTPDEIKMLISEEIKKAVSAISQSTPEQEPKVVPEIEALVKRNQIISDIRASK